MGGEVSPLRAANCRSHKRAALTRFVTRRETGCLVRPAATRDRNAPRKTANWPIHSAPPSALPVPLRGPFRATNFSLLPSARALSRAARAVQMRGASYRQRADRFARRFEPRGRARMYSGSSNFELALLPVRQGDL